MVVRVWRERRKYLMRAGRLAYPFDERDSFRARVSMDC
jgi:hypothetical protein